MRNRLVAGTLALAMAAGTAQTATAHDAPLRPAGQCGPISDALWNKIRKGMTLSQVEHLLDCHATHQQTNEFRTFTSEIYNFQKGSRHLVKVHIRDGKVWIKRSMYR